MFNVRVTALPLLAASLTLAAPAGPVGRPRARDLGVAPGVFPPGALDAITDVPGVSVGHVTRIEGSRVRTGVTAIVPHPGNVFQEKVAGAVFVGNAFGKLAGSTQVDELGTIETPIVLTNTLSVGTAVEAVVRDTVGRPGNEDVRSVNALVGETNDGGLNDIRGGHVLREDVVAAIRGAATGPVEEGSVGAGTGTRCFGWKGGIGTASRKLPARYGGWTLGVLVQTNFGGVLTIDGAPVGRELGRYDFKPEGGSHTEGFTPERAGGLGGAAHPPARRANEGFTPERAGGLGGAAHPPARRASEGFTPERAEDGSCMIVVATDAPLSPRELKRLAARAVFGLARTGSSYSHGSGDYAIAFSSAPEARVRHGETAPRARLLLPGEALSPLFEAALEATEEAVYNSLLRATTVSGDGGTAEAIPIDRVVEVLRRYGRGR
jgi:D-aminopeptidase